MIRLPRLPRLRVSALFPRRSGATRLRAARVVPRGRARRDASIGAAARVRRAAATAPPPPAPPADPARRRRLRLVLVASVIAVACVPLGVGARRLAANPVFRVRKVVVQASAHVSEDELRKLAGIEPGVPWLLLDGRATEARIESNPWVRHARVRRPWPGRVRVSVEECEPVARVEVAGRVYGLCQDLRVVPAGADSLPMLRGHGPDRTNPDALARGLEYVAELRKVGIAGHEPVQLDVDAAHTDCLALPSRGLTVTVGESIPVPVAVRNFLAFVETLDAEGGSRGTLRLVSEDTAVWRASTQRARATG